MATEEEIAAFLKSGGKVEQVPTGVSGYKGGPYALPPDELAAKKKHDKSLPYAASKNRLKNTVNKVK